MGSGGVARTGHSANELPTGLRSGHSTRVNSLRGMASQSPSMASHSPIDDSARSRTLSSRCHFPSGTAPHQRRAIDCLPDQQRGRRGQGCARRFHLTTSPSISGTVNLFDTYLQRFPFPTEAAGSRALLLRTLRLNCLTADYAAPGRNSSIPLAARRVAGPIAHSREPEDNGPKDHGHATPTGPGPLAGAR